MMMRPLDYGDSLIWRARRSVIIAMQCVIDSADPRRLRMAQNDLRIVIGELETRLTALKEKRAATMWHTRAAKAYQCGRPASNPLTNFPIGAKS